MARKKKNQPWAREEIDWIPPAPPVAPKRSRKKKAGAREEVERTEPERAPLPDPLGLEDTLSPVDLPEPAEPLPHPLRWTSIAIAVATLFLAFTNAHAIRGWAYQLPPNEWSARIVTGAEAWYDFVDQAGLNAPVERMRSWWGAAKEVRFGEAPEPPPPDSA